MSKLINYLKANPWKVGTIVFAALFLISAVYAIQLKRTGPSVALKPVTQGVQTTTKPATAPLNSVMLEDAKKFLGCNSPAECEAFCKQPANKTKCDAFMKQYSSSSSAQPAGSVSGPLPIGYIGCSNSQNSANGYQSTAGKKLLWPGYSTGSGAITMWADAKSNFWTYFDAQVAKYGQPQKVWVQLCEPYGGAGITDYAHVKLMLANLKTHSPSTVAYISAINVYDPRVGTCALMGANGQGETDTENWRDQAVRDGLAKKGPDMGPLNSSNTVADHCHPNSAGETLLGTQLHNFFDNL